jgi:ArsR family transcriptional regulator
MNALGDQSRLRITLLIRRLELSVGEIVQILGQSQPRVSRHIRILAEAGIVERRREGAWVFLRSGPRLLDGSLDRLFALPGTDDAKLVLRDLGRLDEVRAARAQMAADYFARHAEEWDSLRTLHIADAEVEAAIRALLQQRPLGRVLDIGTGTGRMIQLFARSADHFVALDNSTEMLRLARAKLSEMPDTAALQARTEIIRGDFNHMHFADHSFDTILLHQVLHYSQDPEHAIAEAARLLAPGGRMLVVDFASHDIEELRTVHAHTRLGFSTTDMVRMFSAAGLTLNHDAQLDGGKLAVKIWLATPDVRSTSLGLRPTDHSILKVVS